MERQKKMLNISLFNNKNSNAWTMANLSVFLFCSCPIVKFERWESFEWVKRFQIFEELHSVRMWTIGYLYEISKFIFYSIWKCSFWLRQLNNWLFIFIKALCLEANICRCLRFSTMLAAASSRCSSWRWRGWKVSGRPTKAVWGRQSPSTRQEWRELQESERTDPIRWARRDCITRDRIHKKWCGRSLSRSQSQRKMDLRPWSLKQNFPEVGFYWHLLKVLIHSGNILCPEKGRFALWICE